MDIKIGDHVRSYDFPSDDDASRRDCYIEGVVREFRPVDGCERYVIEIERDVWNGEDYSADSQRIGTRVYPPVNGTPKLFGGVCNGVEKIEGEHHA